MIKGVISMFKTFLWVVVLIAVALLAPVGYTELACTGKPLPKDTRAPLITDSAYQRSEAATYLTYPEWHIVNAYDEYAKVLETGDPHHYDFIPAITGFWTSLCSLTAQANAHGGGDFDTKLMVYTIGSSFTFEFAMKAAYEETIGHLVTLLRGPYRDNLDEVSAKLAHNYAGFLQQVPWYKYDFSADRVLLRDRSQKSLRDVERRMALGAEFGVKSAYAKLIARGVDATGQADLTIRSVVSGLSEDQLAAIDGVSVIATTDAGTEIETPRYRAFTNILKQISQQGGSVLEIAGNDDILVSVLSGNPRRRGAIVSFPRQGYADYRHLVPLRVSALSEFIRSRAGKDERLEHVYDY